MRIWWSIPLIGLFAVTAMAMLVSSSLSDEVVDRASDALIGANLHNEVSVIGIEGGPTVGQRGLVVVLEGPARSRSAAIVTVQAEDVVERVVYRTTVDRNEVGR